MGRQPARGILRREAIMSAMPFDTLALARRLRGEGRMSPEQAEGVAKVPGEAFREEVSTKVDLRRWSGT